MDLQEISILSKTGYPSLNESDNAKVPIEERLLSVWDEEHKRYEINLFVSASLSSENSQILGKYYEYQCHRDFCLGVTI